MFFNLSARNEWSNTLESGNNSILYPGVSLSFLPTDAFDNLKSNTLNNLKLRLGYGASAGFPTAYNTRNTLNLASRSQVTSDGTVISTNSVSDRLGNADLKPELDTEFEIGIDARLFNKLNFNVSLYRKATKDAIIDQLYTSET